MFYIIRNEVGEAEKVYGYFSIKDIQDYCEDKYPNKSKRWEVIIPKDYKGEIDYLPEKNV